MDLCFLAAGVGRRMGDLVRDFPKSLVAIREARSILDINLSNYRAVCKDSHALIIGGYKWEALVRFAEQRDRANSSVRVALNANYATGGPLHSLVTAISTLPPLSSNIAFANGDTVYGISAFNALANFKTDGIGLLASYEQHPEPDDMRVRVSDDGRILEVRKDPDADGPGLLSAGLLIVNGMKARAVFEESLGDAISLESTSSKPLTWHSVIALIARSGMSVDPVIVPRNAWQEFDSPECIEKYKATMLEVAG